MHTNIEHWINIKKTLETKTIINEGREDKRPMRPD